MTAPPRVLVVDVHPVNLELARFVLEADGFAVDTADSAAQACQALEERPPDVILMDIQLPGRDGLSLTRQLKADPRTRHIPIVAFTAHAMQGDERALLDGGCDGYLAKPIDVSRFAGQVRAFMRPR